MLARCVRACAIRKQRWRLAAGEAGRGEGRCAGAYLLQYGFLQLAVHVCTEAAWHWWQDTAICKRHRDHVAGGIERPNRSGTRS